jgi:hypothetical protein
MLNIPTDELEALIDAVDLWLQQAEGTRDAMIADAGIENVEELLELTADHDDQVGRLTRCKKRLEEELEQRRQAAA